MNENENFRTKVSRGWFRARHLQVVIDAWPDAIVKPLVVRKGWVLFLVRRDRDV